MLDDRSTKTIFVTRRSSWNEVDHTASVAMHTPTARGVDTIHHQPTLPRGVGDEGQGGLEEGNDTQVSLPHLEY